MEGDAEIVIGRRVIDVDHDRVFVVDDRLVDRAVFEEQIPDRGDRSGGTRLGFKRRDQLGDRAFAITAADRDDGELVSGERDLRRPFGHRQGFRERAGRVIDPPAFEMMGTTSERLGRRFSGDQPPQSVEERHVGVLHVDVVTLFPEMFAPVIGLSIVGRAVERGLIDVQMHHLLDALERGERADERPYGGGPGMVLRIEPLARVLDAIIAAAPPGERRRIVLTSASGPVFRQSDAAAWAQLDRLILICGHYEGVDERLVSLYPVEEISLGEFVLTGGEIAAMALLDATARLVPGAIDPESASSESWVDGGVDHPAYTRPPSFRGVDVPPVLLSGDHAKIAEWRREESRRRAVARNRKTG